MAVPSRISEFITENEVMTIATCNKNNPYCATVFYVFLPEKNVIAFMSDRSTRHMQEAICNENIAGSIVAKNVSLAKVQGLQLNGRLTEPKDEFKEECKTKYLWAFPMASLHQSTIWAIELTFLKLTDYRLGFGKKLIWNKADEPS